jgi:hypothetical protein
VGSSECSLSLFMPDCHPVRAHPLGIGCSPRVTSTKKYRPHGLNDPALPLAFSSALRFSFDVPRRPRLGDRRSLYSSFAFLQSLNQQHLAADQIQSDLTAPLMSFSFPTAHSRCDGPLYAGLASLLRSTFRVSFLPSWRFTPAASGPVLFRTGSAPGIHPSECSPLER